MPNQREVMQRTRREARNGGRDDFLDRSAPVVDRNYRSVTARPRGNPQTNLEQHHRSLSGLERVAGH